MKKTLLLLGLFAFTVFASCSKEDTWKDKDYKGKKELEKDKGEACFELVYPVTYILPDDSAATGDTEEEVWTIIKAWYEANSEVEEKPILVYPVEVILADGSTESIENEEEMILLKGDCYGKEELELCEWDEATEASGAEFEKYVVEELVYSEECECIISGMEKFLENGITKYLIYYKTEACDGYGYKVTCIDGDCETAPEKCKFLQDCGGQ